MELEQDKERLILVAQSNQIKLLDALATMLAGALGVKMGGKPSMLEYLNTPRDTGKLTMDIFEAAVVK